MKVGEGVGARFLYRLRKREGSDRGKWEKTILEGKKLGGA